MIYPTFVFLSEFERNLILGEIGGENSRSHQNRASYQKPCSDP